MNRYILSLDQGTTSSRAIIFDQSGNAVSSYQKEFTQYTAAEARVEHDAEEIWSSQLSAAHEAIKSARIPIDSIDAIGITNQRETTVFWEKASGKPLGRAIVWQCRRSTDICRRLKEEGHEDFIRSRTGLLLDPYFSGTKILWRFENDEGLRERASGAEILFGTVDSWLLWNLSGGKVHATDVSNASRTLLMNLQSGTWDEDILKLLDIPGSILPEIRPSIGDFGMTDPKLFGRAIPICGIAGDQHAALFGHQAFSKGDVKNTYGTGCFILMNVGEKPVKSKGGLLSTAAWSIDGKISYALEGSVFMGGASLQWLRDDLELVENVQEINRLSEKVDDTDGVYLVPAFQGLGTPWWQSDARAGLIGLSRASKKTHICRAFLEAIAYRSRDVIEVMEKDSGFSMGRLKVDGGATHSDLLMQFQADILGIPLERPAFSEITAMGAAFMAGLGGGLWKDLSDLPTMTEDTHVFQPEMSEERRSSLYSGWLKAVKRIL